jgi:hypothetical protein
MEKIPNPKSYSEGEYIKINNFKNELFSYLFESDREKMRELQKELADKALELKQKYSNDVDGYAMYQILIGGSLHEDDQNIIATDFPGEDSVETFLVELESKYRSK